MEPISAWAEHVAVAPCAIDAGNSCDIVSSITGRAGHKDTATFRVPRTPYLPFCQQKGGKPSEKKRSVSRPWPSLPRPMAAQAAFRRGLRLGAESWLDHTMHVLFVKLGSTSPNSQPA